MQGLSGRAERQGEESSDGHNGVAYIGYWWAWSEHRRRGETVGDEAHLKTLLER